MIARFVSLRDHNPTQRAEVIIEHFRTHVAGRVGGIAKAMAGTASSEHAVHTTRALVRHNDDHRWVKETDEWPLGAR